MCEANDVAIDVTKRTLSGKMIQGSHCPEVFTLTDENGCYIMKLNDMCLLQLLLQKLESFLINSRELSYTILKLISDSVGDLAL